MSTLFNPDKEKYEISVWEDSLVPQTTEGEKTILEHFEEQKIATIGAHDMDTPAAASNPVFVENVNGSYTLTFSMYYKYFDEDEMDYVENPFVQFLHNERKIKLFYRNKWYDLIIKNCVEDSSNYTYTYTAKSLYTTELGKNGFKVELDSELENNQGTVTELGKTILKGTDWEISPVEEGLTDDEKREWIEKYGEDSFSDIIVQTKIEPLYVGVLGQEVQVKSVNSYLPDRDTADEELSQLETIAAGETVLFFYSDVNNNSPQPQILYRPDGQYKTDVNEDIITNSYNYRIISPEVVYIDSETSYNIPSVCYDPEDSITSPEFSVYNGARGEKVIRSAKTGYDPDLDEFITYYKDEDGNSYYGYEKTESLSSHLTQNFLANSDEFTSVNSGWIFDGTPSISNLKEDGTITNDGDTTYTGQIYLLNQEGFAYDPNNEGGAESVMVMRLRNKIGGEYYPDSGGHLYKVEKKIYDENKNPITETRYIPVKSDEGDSFETQIANQYFTLRSQGHEKFVNLSDEELWKIIDSALLNMRYSDRTRRAINTGLAANRKVIENFSNGEEYVFATSLGKYKEGEEPPEYGREIKYGATTPTELFVFSEENNTDIDKEVSEQAYLKAYKEITENPQKYLEVDEKGNIANAIYKQAYEDYVNTAYTEYQTKYLDSNWISKDFVNSDTKKKWERGGRDFREAFRNYLKNTEESSSNLTTEDVLTDAEVNDIVPSEIKKEVESCSFVQTVINVLKDKEFNPYEKLYKDLQAPFFNAWSKAYIDKCNTRAETSDFLWISRKNNWIVSGNDGIFPTFGGIDPETKEEISGINNGDYSSINSFCGQLYYDLYIAIRDKFTLIEINEGDSSDKISFTVMIPKVEQVQKLIEQTFDNLVEQMGYFGSLKAKRDYRIPSLLDKNGGIKYQQHKASWEENAKEHALLAVVNSGDFISKFDSGSYTPEIKESEKDYQSFEGEIEFLNGFKVEWEKAIKNYNMICDSSYIGTEDYYKQIDDMFKTGWDTQKNKWESNEYPKYYENISNGEWIKEEEYLKLEENLKPEYEEVSQSTMIANICGWGFCKIYFDLKDAISSESLQTATYTINNEEYSLNKPSIIKVEQYNEDEKDSYIYMQNSDGQWEPHLISTSDDGAEYVAYEDEENGYYVFDKQSKKVRLFNPKTDREKPTYLPEKSKDGAYVYDEVRGIYRKFRNWRNDEYIDLKTGEPLEQIKGGCPGDIIYHPVKWFDGRIGDEEEMPQRYDMVRTYEDEDERAYLTEKSSYKYCLNIKKTWKDDLKEIFDFDFDFQADDEEKWFEFDLPAGHQLDYFYEDEDGSYIKLGNNDKNPLEEFNDDVKAFFTSIFEDINQGWEQVKNFFENLFGIEDTKSELGQSVITAFKAAEQEFIEFNEDAMEAVYGFAGEIIKEVETAYWTIKIAHFGLISDEKIKKRLLLMGFSEDEVNNYYEIKDQRSRSAETPNTNEELLGAIQGYSISETIIIPLATYLGKSLSQIGICMNNNSDNEGLFMENLPRFLINGVDSSKITKVNLKNWPEGTQPNYCVNALKVESLEELIYLLKNNKIRAYEPPTQQTRTVAADGEGEVTTDDKTLIADTNEAYVKYRWWYWRHWGRKRYNLKEKLCVPTAIDGEFKVYNNIEDAVSKNYSIKTISDYNAMFATLTEEEKIKFGPRFYIKDKLISYKSLKETDFSPNVFSMQPDEKMDKSHCVYNEYYNYYRPFQSGDAGIEYGFYRQTYNPITRPEYKDSFEGLQNPCMLVDGIYIPYDKRVYNLGLRRFYRKRDFPDSSEIKDEDLQNYYVYHDGEYITLYDYYEKYSKTSTLDYSGLKIYFTPEYNYDAANFAIQIDGKKAFNYEGEQEKEPKYLGLTIESEPDGFFDTKVFNETVIEEEVKERWCYWKIRVNEGVSLIEDQLSSIGLVFENAQAPLEQNGEKVYKDFTFLGMQFFKYYEYESKQIEEYEEYEEVFEKDNYLYFEYDTQNKEYKIIVDRTSGNEGKKLEELLQEFNLYLKFSEIFTDEEEFGHSVEDNFDCINALLIEKGWYLSKTDISIGNYDATIICNLIQIKERKIKTMLPIVPGQAPDAKELVITNYYIYDPEETTSKEDVIYAYRGQNPEDNGFKVEYDDLCQKIRSIKGKESNYFKLLQDECDTFECWMEQIIPHDGMGRVKYIEKPVYEQTSIEEDEEPQIYVGSLPDNLAEEEYSLKGYIKVPSKAIRFKEYVGRPNYTGFKYGVNLQHIKRTIDSEAIATRTIVKPNSNEYATDGFCTIQRAEENILKENFIYDFTYYINKKMLKYSEINPDLYSSNPEKLGYYVKLARLNKENDQLILDLSAVMIELDKANADYETAVLGRDAAQEEIAKIIEILKNNYDTYGNLIDTPWTYNKSKEYAQKTQTSSYAHTATINGPDGTYEVEVPALTTVVEYPKYNDTIRNYFDQMDTLQRNHDAFKNAAIEAKANKEKYEAERDRLLELEKEIVEKKNELNKLFYHKYSRYIQEGSWIDENYIDDNLYYLDALAVSRTSSRPKITYDIGVVDLYGAIGYEEDKEVLNFELGDRTYVEDTEFFGYVKETNKPYQEQIVVTEKTYVLEDASANKIQVKNYSTQFDSLFQRIAATSQTLQFNEGQYGRVSSILNNDGSIDADRLQQALDSTSLAFKNSVNENVYWDHTGIWVKSFETDANILRLTSLGIGLSTDGGNTYMTAITGAGINAAAITSGMLNVDNLMIGAKSAPNFLWNKFGISSFKTLEDGIDYSTFVRLDQYGVYGIKNWSKNGTIPEQMSINDTFEPLRLSDITENENAVFGLTWDGFFLNTGSGTDRGRVTIGTNQDIRMSVKDDSGWRDRVVIGRMTDITTNEQTYGFRLINENGEIVMDTNLQGELYLKRKLRISNFTNEIRYDQDLKYDENGNIVQGDNPSFKNVEDRVTLGIVDTYDRQDSYKKVELSGVYSSSQYLTKVFSVKSNDTIEIEQFNEELLSQIIDKNENFAIFDNGNLFAKNAWIEGNIHATTGFIGGLKIVDNGIGTEVFSKNIGWRITPEEARFNNVIVSGSIKAATFEYQEIQTIGSTFLIRPTGKVVEYEFLTVMEYINKYKQEELSIPYAEISEQDKFLVLKTSSKVNFGDAGHYLKIIPNISNSLEACASKDFIYMIATPQNYQKDNGEEATAILLIVNKKEIDNNLLQYLIGATIIDIGESNEKEIGIVFNSTNNSAIFPSNGISVFETWVDDNKWALEHKIFLGKIPEEGLIADKFSNRNATYGLYTDNAYLNGALVIESEDLIAGIDTKNTESMSSYHNFKNNGKIIFYAGQRSNDKNKPHNYNFIVDDQGNLFAKSGYFQGDIYGSIIESSILKTTTLIGNGEDTALKIIADDTVMNDAIWFGRQYMDESTQEIKTQNYLKLSQIQLEVEIPSYLKEIMSTKNIFFDNNSKKILGYFGNDGIGLYSNLSNSEQYNYNIELANFYYKIFTNNEQKLEFTANNKGMLLLSEEKTVVQNNFEIHSTSLKSNIKYEAVLGGYDIYITA